MIVEIDEKINTITDSDILFAIRTGTMTESDPCDYSIHVYMKDGSLIKGWISEDTYDHYKSMFFIDSKVFWSLLNNMKMNVLGNMDLRM